MKKLSAILATILLSGCTTIHFDNGAYEDVLNKSSTQKTEKWHHILALDLYEYSEPIGLKKECNEKEWVTVKTERSLLNGLANGVVNSFGPIWYPKTATVTCGKN